MDLRNALLVGYRQCVERPPSRDEVERAANGPVVGPQSAPLVDGVLTSLCRPGRQAPRGPQGVPALADDTRTQGRARAACGNAVATLCQYLPRDGRTGWGQYCLRSNRTCCFIHIQPDGPMALSRGTPKERRRAMPVRQAQNLPHALQEQVAPSLSTRCCCVLLLTS